MPYATATALVLRWFSTEAGRGGPGSWLHRSRGGLLVAAGIAAFTAAHAAPLEEITVTARRASENIQDIPVSVTAFGAEFIEQQGISNTADVARLIPGVQFDQSFSAADTRITIRGIASERGRTSAAVLVDGVDVSGENITAGGGSSLLNTRLLDLERVEVIKGPQSALYGRNAFAGAINYVTRQPSLAETDISVYADVADYGTYDLRSFISGPVIEGKLALGVNFGYYTTDGYFRNNNQDVPGGNARLNGAESKGGRLVALWAPTDAVTVTGSLSYSETESDQRALVKVGNANTFYLDGEQLPAGTVADFTFSGDMDYGQWLGKVSKVPEQGVNLSISERTNAPFAGSADDTLLGYVKVDWDLGATTFKSVTSYLSNDATLDEDVDYQDGPGTFFMGTGLSIANEYRDATDTRYFNQEFTLESNRWSRGNWLVGVSYFDESTDNSDNSTGWFNDPFISFVPGFCGTDPFQVACSYAASALAGTPAKTISRDTESLSVFGLVGLDITDRLRVTAEARYIDDEITVSTNTAIDRVSQYILNLPIDFSFGAPPVLPATDTQKSDTINPRLAVDYRLTDDVLLYGSGAKGTKPAGFGTSQFATPQNARVSQEKLYAWELGAKTTWIDGRLQANVALYFNDYQDRQVGVTVTDPNTGWPQAGIVNAAEAEVRGFEVDISWRPIEPLTLGLAYAYTDAEWTDFNYSEIRPDGANEKDRAICGNAAGDCSGMDVAGVPENALSLLGSYTAPLRGDIEWFTTVVGVFQDERAVFDRINTPTIDSYWSWDLQLGLQTSQWSVQVYADNLLDDDTVRWGQGYNDFRDGMYGGNFGGEPRDETVFAFLTTPRVVGVRGRYKF